MFGSDDFFLAINNKYMQLGENISKNNERDTLELKKKYFFV